MSAPSDIGRVVTYEPYHWETNHRVRDFPFEDRTEPVSFHHPDYIGDNILVMLERFDQPGDGGITGVHYGFAFTACTIMACNEPGYLVEGSPDGERVTHDWDSVLLGEKYYFHVINKPTNGPYPVCPTFQDWEMPSTLPPEWDALHSRYSDLPMVNASDMGIGVRNRDQHCTMTQSNDALEVAYIVPEVELKWFYRNYMAKYAQNCQLSPEEAMNDVGNGLLLRRDRRKSWDDRLFVFFPKNGNLVTHVLYHRRELGSLHHNVQSTITDDLSPEFYYARFAHTIIPMMERLFLVPAKRKVKVYLEENREYEIVERDYRLAPCPTPRPLGEDGSDASDESEDVDSENWTILESSRNNGE